MIQLCQSTLGLELTYQEQKNLFHILDRTQLNKG